MQYIKYKGCANFEIKNLFVKTFTKSEGESEGNLIGNLVEDLLLVTLCVDKEVFISVEKGEIVGCIFFTKLRFEEENINAYLLSPVAIHSDFQGKGIGQALINFGHNELAKEGVELIITYGDINFYSKVGFKQISEDIIKAPLKLSYPEGWIAKSLINKEIKAIKGKMFCVEALCNQVYW
jgi:predicted N-acetyltransferase YhbS